MTAYKSRCFSLSLSLSHCLSLPPTLPLTLSLSLSLWFPLSLWRFGFGGVKQSYCCTGTSVPPPIFSMIWARERERSTHHKEPWRKTNNNNNEKEKLGKRTTRVTTSSDHNTHPHPHTFSLSFFLSFSLCLTHSFFSLSLSYSCCHNWRTTLRQIHHATNCLAITVSRRTVRRRIDLIPEKSYQTFPAFD